MFAVLPVLGQEAPLKRAPCNHGWRNYMCGSEV